MIRGLLKLILVVVVAVVVGAFLLGYDIGDFRGIEEPGAIGTTGQERAREVGAEIGARTAAAADATRRAVEDGSLTTKIKAKMALDDTVKALAVDVDTVNGAVTLTGTVDSAAQKERMLQLARETEGVASVVDRIRVR